MVIFISYASEDFSLADEIHIALIQNEYNVFFAPESLPQAGEFRNRIRDEILKAELFIFLISAHSIKEGCYTLTELEHASSRWPNPDGFIIPVIVNKKELDSIFESIPAYLRAVSFVNARGNITSELLTIVAPIYQDHTAWTAIPQDSSIAIYKAYIDTHPNSRYVRNATRKIRELEDLENKAWQNAKQANTIPALKQYIKSNYQGRHIDEAKDLVRRKQTRKYLLISAVGILLLAFLYFIDLKKLYNRSIAKKTDSTSKTTSVTIPQSKSYTIRIAAKDEQGNLIPEAIVVAKLSNNTPVFSKSGDIYEFTQNLSDSVAKLPVILIISADRYQSDTIKKSFVTYAASPINEIILKKPVVYKSDYKITIRINDATTKNLIQTARVEILLNNVRKQILTAHNGQQEITLRLTPSEAAQSITVLSSSTGYIKQIRRLRLSDDENPMLQFNLTPTTISEPIGIGTGYKIEVYYGGQANDHASLIEDIKRMGFNVVLDKSFSGITSPSIIWFGSDPKTERVANKLSGQLSTAITVDNYPAPGSSNDYSRTIRLFYK